MQKSDFEAWFKKLGQAWVNRNPDAALTLFSKDVKYYESVFQPPCNWDGALALWQIVPKNQEGVSFEFDLLSYSEDQAVANFRVSRTLLPDNVPQEINGIFLIKLNEKGLCTLFKQWRTIR